MITAVRASNLGRHSHTPMSLEKKKPRAFTEKKGEKKGKTKTKGKRKADWEPEAEEVDHESDGDPDDEEIGFAVADAEYNRRLDVWITEQAMKQRIPEEDIRQMIEAGKIEPPDELFDGLDWDDCDDLAMSTGDEKDEKKQEKPKAQPQATAPAFHLQGWVSSAPPPQSQPYSSTAAAMSITPNVPLFTKPTRSAPAGFAFSTAAAPVASPTPTAAPPAAPPAAPSGAEERVRKHLAALAAAKAKKR